MADFASSMANIAFQLEAVAQSAGADWAMASMRFAISPAGVLAFTVFSVEYRMEPAGDLYEFNAMVKHGAA